MSVLGAYNVEMYFGDRLLFKEVCFDIAEKECVALVGPNGTGKTTLFRLITGELEPTAGQIIKGKNVRLGYMEQHACAESNRSIYEEMLSVFEPLIRMEVRLEEIAHDLQKGRGDIDAFIAEQSTLHEQFERQDGLTFRSRTRAALVGLGFSEKDFNLPCSAVSGGQRSKISLGKLLLSGADLLLLDEPTNHLDMDSREVLEDALSGFTGTIITVSHDRYFINRVADRILEMRTDGVTEYIGNYDDYIERKNRPVEQEAVAGKTRTELDKEKRREKMSKQALRQMKLRAQEAEKAVSVKEAEIASFEEQLADPALYADTLKAAQVNRDYQKAQDDLLVLYEAWEQAEAALQAEAD